MTDDIDVSNDRSDDLPIALKAGLKTMEDNNEKIIKEALMGYFPNLDKKEFAVCEMIVAAHHDLEGGRYSAIVVTAPINYRIFRNEKDVEDTIKTLIEKRIVRARLTSVTKERIGLEIPISVRNISLTLDNDVQDEIVDEMRREFASAIEQACAIDNHLQIVKKFYAEKINPD